MAFKYIGTSSTIITDGGVENPTINGVVVTTKNEGNIVFYTDKRFLWTSNAWKYQGDINTHTDVQDALNTIMEAYKGEEVRGSIYDAIALIDTRSYAMEDIVGQNVEPIVENIIGNYIDITDLVYTIDDGVVTCNKTYTEIIEILSGSKRLVFYVSPSFTSAVYLCIGTIAPAYSSEEYLDVKLYYIDYDYGNVLHYCSITHFADRIRLNGDTATSIQAKLTAGANITIDPITNIISATGGGGSYSEGYGIDITNDEISVKLRSSNPGLAFTNDGELYATGSGGSAESFVININDIPPAALYINKTFNEIITQIGQDYGLIRVFLNYKDGYFNRKVEGIISHYESYGQEAHIQFRFNISNDKNNTIRYYLLELDNEFSLEDEYTQENQSKLTAGTGINITNNVISIDEPVYITMTEGANGIVDTSFIVSITEANFLAKFGIGAKDLMAILSGSYNVAKLGIKVYDDTSISMDSYLDKIPILDIRYSKYDEELSLAEGATMIFIWNHCTYEFTVNVEYSDEFRGTISKINGSVLKTLIANTGYGINSGTNSISVDTSVIQKKLASVNAGTGISITNDGNGNPVISLDLPQAEGGGF